MPPSPAWVRHGSRTEADQNRSASFKIRSRLDAPLVSRISPMTPRAAAPAPLEQSPGFAALGLDPRLVDALAALGYEEPTPVQREAIPPLLAGRDVLGQAATGTGKTAAFALPMLHLVTPDVEPRTRTTGLILVPTRELAMQVAEAV